MAYVADFVTGRSMAEREKAVGVVIVPRTGGWPDPVKAAALDPVHAHDRFSPLSLPLKGFINDEGFFEPERGQLGLTLLLETAGYPNWPKFFKAAYAADVDDPGFVHDGERVVAGIAAMRPETFKTVVGLGARGIKHDSAEDAARIYVDAQKRAFINKEMSAYMVATLAGTPQGDTWATLEGETITVPHCALGLADGHPWELERGARQHIRRRFEHAFDAGETGMTEFARLFEELSGFQKLSRGLSHIGKYFTPGGFMRHDNLSAVMDLQVATLAASVRGIAERDMIGVEWREERFLNEMLDLSKKIAKIQDDLQKEMDVARRYLGESEPETGAPTPGM